MTVLDAFIERIAEEQKNLRVTKDDVFGRYDHDTHQRIDDGMVVARHDQVCPIWGDVLPYKSVTVVVPAEHVRAQRVPEVIYWLTFVHGADCVSRRWSIPDGTVAIRSDYTAW